MITDVEGVEVGHWTNVHAATGCTVIVLPERTVASGEVRGGAPATREFALLDPSRTVGRVDAVVLSGGSAFGLAAADGVMTELENRGRGFPTNVGSVPIVIGMSLFDLAVGSPKVRPGPEEGRLALAAASAGPYPVGTVGAGTGATVHKWQGSDHRRPGGLGTATVRSGDVVVSALLAVNAFGAISDGTEIHDPGTPVVEPVDNDDAPDASRAVGTNTTIGVVVTNASVDKVGCHKLSQAAHGGLSRALFPAHTEADGDAIVAAATGSVDGDSIQPLHLRVLVQNAVTLAVRSVGQ